MLLLSRAGNSDTFASNNKNTQFHSISGKVPMFALLVDSLTADITPTVQKGWPASYPVQIASYKDAQEEVNV